MSGVVESRPYSCSALGVAPNPSAGRVQFAPVCEQRRGEKFDGELVSGGHCERDG